MGAAALNYFEDDTVTVYAGDCVEVMRGMPDASVDSVVCDPPYNLSFMGREWDTHKGSQEFQEWCRSWAAECLRVLKPGGYLAAFGGTRTYHRLTCGIEDSGFEIRDSIGEGRGHLLAWVHGSGFPKSTSALKPAWEPIVVGRKPLVGTVARNVTQYGTGALNIDGCRITMSAEDREIVDNRSGSDDGLREGIYSDGIGKRRPGSTFKSAPGGRWPTNVVLDEHAAAELDRQSGTLTSGKPGIKRGGNDGPAYGAESRPPGTQMSGYGDSGGASRFFPVFKYTAKAGSDERPDVDGVRHPTVKPLDLMRWLVRLVTPPNGVVLDPFAGSGTTGEAAVLEHMRAILVEREPDYLPLIVARLTKPISVGFDFESAS